MGRPLRIGLYSPYFGAVYGGGERYLAAAAVALRSAFPDDSVTIVGGVLPDRDRYLAALGVDLAGIELRGSVGRAGRAARAANRLRILRPLRNLVLSRRAGALSSDFDLFGAQVYAIPIACRAPAGILLCQFPHRNPRPGELDGYGLIVCQSEYVRAWVRKRWGRDAVVVHPPVELPVTAFEPRRKEQLILSVGRFIRSGHAKRQDVLVRAFRALCDGGLAGWELHLAGSVHRAGVHRGYFEEVARLAEGYPIRLHADLPQADLEGLYARAAIYWHAAGWGADAEAEPERLEHFGITTVEAMARGAVPVVFGGGGQAEIVEDGVTGRLWRTPSELVDLTRELAMDPAARSGLAAAAAAAAPHYSREAFVKRWLEVVGPVVAEVKERVAGETDAARP